MGLSVGSSATLCVGKGKTGKVSTYNSKGGPKWGGISGYRGPTIGVQNSLYLLGLPNLGVRLVEYLLGMPSPQPRLSANKYNTIT